MKNRIPRVSIGLPVFNGERFLRQALASILAQTFEDFELTISDNASTDGTQDICVKYAAKDRRIRYIRNHLNAGASKNYNAVFRAASGEYFRWAAADDLFAPESLDRCQAVLDSHPEVVLCYPKTVLIDEHGNVIREYVDNLDLRFESVPDRFREAIDRIGMVNVIYGLIRSDILRKTSLIRNYPGADIDLLVELTLYGQFYEVSEPLFFRRLHANAQSSLKTVDGRQEFFDPTTKGKLFLPRWKHSFQRFISIMRSRVNPVTKIHLCYILYRSMRRSWDDFIKEPFVVFGQVLHARQIRQTRRTKS